MRTNGVGVVVGVVALMALAIPHGAAADGPVGSSGQVGSAGDQAESAERVDNLRLQRIATGSMRGRLVVAGSLDHLPDEGVAHDVVVRMTMTVPRKDGTRRTVGRKVLEYRLPAGVSPQDMTLRWLLDKRQSLAVERAGDGARVSVVVRESRAAGPIITYLKVAERLRVERLTAPPSYGSSPRSMASTVFIPAGLYANDANYGYYLWTAEDPTGAPYVGAAGFGGDINSTNIWSLSPLWLIQGYESGSPGPGNGYVYMNGSVPTWDFEAMWTYGASSTYAGCTMVASITGSFTQSGAGMSWDNFLCDGEPLYASAGSVSGIPPMTPSP